MFDFFNNKNTNFFEKKKFLSLSLENLTKVSVNIDTNNTSIILETL